MPETLLPPSAIHMRDARPEDVQHLQRRLYPGQSPEDVEAVLAHALRLRGANRAVVVVAEVDGEIQASAQLSIGHGKGEIQDLIVAEGWRERGLGRALIGYLVGAARARELRTVEIAAEASNARALSLYQRLGFRLGRTARLDLGDGGVDVIYLEKTVDSGQ